jgi:hypothetical protein
VTSEPGQIDPALIRIAMDQARQSARQIGDLQAANFRTIRTLETAINQAIKGSPNDPSTVPPAVAEHRRQHRKGTLSPIKTDPELQAFIRARIPTHTYAEIAAEVAASFPPGRRTSVASLSRWWSAERDGPTANRMISDNPR